MLLWNLWANCPLETAGVKVQSANLSTWLHSHDTLLYFLHKMLSHKISFEQRKITWNYSIDYSVSKTFQLFKETNGVSGYTTTVHLLTSEIRFVFYISTLYLQNVSQQVSSWCWEGQYNPHLLDSNDCWVTFIQILVCPVCMCLYIIIKPLGDSKNDCVSVMIYLCATLVNHVEIGWHSHDEPNTSFYSNC